jgi:hypothetical protein
MKPGLERSLDLDISEMMIPFKLGDAGKSAHGWEGEEPTGMR